MPGFIFNEETSFSPTRYYIFSFGRKITTFMCPQVTLCLLCFALCVCACVPKRKCLEGDRDENFLEHYQVRCLKLQIVGYRCFVQQKRWKRGVIDMTPNEHPVLIKLAKLAIFLTRHMVVKQTEEEFIDISHLMLRQRRSANCSKKTEKLQYI